MDSSNRRAVFTELKNFPVIRQVYHFAYKPVWRVVMRVRFYVDVLMRHRLYQHELCDKVYDVSPELSRKIRHAVTIDEAVEINRELLVMLQQEQDKRFDSFRDKINSLSDI